MDRTEVLLTITTTHRPATDLADGTRLEQALAAQPRLVSRRGPVIGIENARPQWPPIEEAR
jgi:hypothetical protein